MRKVIQCRTCRRDIPADAPQGLCPRCVFGLVGGGDAATLSRDLNSAGLPDREAVRQAFPQLEILELIGQGGMGAVYRVRQISLDRIAALKLLNIKLADDPLFQERFAREAKLMARLLHPNIATIFEFGQSGDFCFLLMEFIDGVNLREAIRTQSTTTDEALRIIPQICDALQYAHDQGVIHRDVKPENILLDKYGRVKLVDFGLAKLNAPTADQLSLTGTQQIMGTMNYMAPEQREPSGSVDHRADIYSLGVVFYELLTNELPLGKFAEPSARSKTSRHLDPVVMRTLERDPEARYQSASEVKTAVDAARHFETVPQNTREVGGLGKWPSTGDDEITLHFQIGDNVNSWKSGGIARLTADGLQLEYHRKNPLMGFIMGLGKNFLPLKEVASVRLKNGPVARGLMIQTRSLECVDGFPDKNDRGIFLRTRADDDEDRKRLHDRLVELIGQSPTDPFVAARHREQVRRKLRLPAQGLAATGLLNLVVASLCILLLSLELFPGLSFWPKDPVSIVERVFSGQLPGSIQRVTSVQPEAKSSTSTSSTSTSSTDEDAPGSPESIVLAEPPTPNGPEENGIPERGISFPVILILIGIVLAIPFGLIQLFSAVEVFRMNHYWLAMTGFISAVVFLHPAWVIGLPFGIWGMVALGNERAYDAFQGDEATFAGKSPKTV